MYRAALRSSPARVGRQAGVAGAGRRMLATAPASKHSTWKGSVLRWGVAVGGLYWYNTSPIFADEIAPPMISAAPEVPEPEFSTVDAVLLEKRKQEAAAAEKKAAEKAAAPSSAAAADGAGEATDSVGALEEEAGQQGAFNPETGEINWDCPCLGGMAHGPCGEEFKTAFSCFVHSEADPKGMDCIDKFQHMQDCFRQYPEIYGAELNDEDEPQDEAAGETPAAVDVTAAAAAEPAPEGPEAPAAAEVPAVSTEPKDEASAPASSEPAPAPEKESAPAPEPAAVADVAADAVATDVSKGDAKTEDANRLVPKAAFDATSANNK